MNATFGPNRLYRALVFICSAIALIAAGCGGGGTVGLSTGGASAAAKRHRIAGVAHGGQNPVGGSSINLYAVGIADETDGPEFLASTTTDSHGNFVINSIDCSEVDLSGSPPLSPNLFIVATGGDSGNGPNSAIGLMAPLGTCDTVANNDQTVIINELTTVAGEWALQQFDDGSGQGFTFPLFPGFPSPYSPEEIDPGGVADAVLTAGNLIDINSADSSVSGNPSSFLPTPAQCASGSPPVNCDGLERLNTLADIIAACVNSSGANSTACATLLCDAIPGATYNAGSCTNDSNPQTPLTDTLMAASLIAFNPNNNVVPLFNLATPNAPFEPTLGSTPDGWEIALNYASNFSGPDALAIDQFGDVFVANGTGNSVTEMVAQNGYQSSALTAPMGVTLSKPVSLAFDSNQNLFVANFDGDSVSELLAPNYTSGNQINNSSFTPSPGFSGPISLGVDGSDNVFVANQSGGDGGNGSVTELLASGSYTSANVFDNANTSAAFGGPTSLALDFNNNVFVANKTGADGHGSVSELGAPDYTSPSGVFDNTNTSPVAAFDMPVSIAVSQASNSVNCFFVTNTASNSVTGDCPPSYQTEAFNIASGGPISFDAPDAIAVDGLSQLFVANANGNSLAVLAPLGFAATFAPPGAGLNKPVAIAIDGSGNVFLANFSGNSISQFIGLAAPPAPTFEISAGSSTIAVLVLLGLLGTWYGRKFVISSRRRIA